MDELKAGIYQHYKGPLYLVLGLAHDANDDTISEYDNVLNEYVVLAGREVVVYIGLQLDEAHVGPRLAVRTLEDFFQEVCAVRDCPRFGVARGSGTQHDGCTVTHQKPRFTYMDMRYGTPLTTKPKEPTSLKDLTVPICSLCMRSRTLGDPAHPMDSYDYTPMQAMTGQPFGWYSGNDGEVCPECMTKTMGRA